MGSFTVPAPTDLTFKIGVDGGGTKTALILVDAAQAVIARHHAAGCNPSIVGPDSSRRLLADALSTFAAQLPPGASVSHTLLCMAGNPAFWRETAAQLPAPFGQVTTTDDSRPVLEFATDGAAGLVLHGGTGSFVAALAPPRDARDLPDPFHPHLTSHYAGGLGWRFGDPGSGYDLGRRTLARALLELQGAAPPTPVGALLRERFPAADARALTRHFYTLDQPNPEIAAFAPALLHLAHTGDETARNLLHQSFRPLLEVAMHLATQLFPATALDTLPARVSGPILTHPATLAWWSRHAPLSLSPLAAPPIDGVLRLLASLA